MHNFTCPLSASPPAPVIGHLFAAAAALLLLDRAVTRTTLLLLDWQDTEENNLFIEAPREIIIALTNIAVD